MRPRRPLPKVLTIAGSDSGGGAGIQADLRTFALLGVRGATAITCLTAQNRRAVSRLEPVSALMVRAQLESIFAEGRPAAVKTGMLYSVEIVRAVARFLAEFPGLPLVVDPVMIATSGTRLLQVKAAKILAETLFPLAALVTPNRAEAEWFTGRKIETPEELRAAARAMHGAFGCAILAKGGHLPKTSESIDILFDGQEEWMFSAPRARRRGLHGTGCAYSAAVAAGLAQGKALPEAVRLAKQFITRSIFGEGWDKNSKLKPGRRPAR